MMIMSKRINTPIFHMIFLTSGLYIFIPYNIDLWWHLQVGKDILNGIWPSPDIYSFTSCQNWTIHSWLCDCFFYIFYYSSEYFCAGMGIKALNVFRFILLLLIAYLFYELTLRKTKNQTLSLLIAMLVATTNWSREIRPFLFTPLLFYIFYQHLRLRKPLKSSWYTLPILMMIWSNIHGGFVIVNIIILMTVILNLLFPAEAYHTKEWIYLGLLIIIFSFFNPHPVALLERIFHADQYPTLDWRSIYWWLIHSPFQSLNYTIPYTIVILAWLCSIFKNKLSIKKMIVFSFIVDIISLFFAFYYVRFIWLIVFPFFNALIRLNKSIPKENKVDIRFVYIAFIILFFSQHTPPRMGIYQEPTGSIKYLTENNLYGNVLCNWAWSGYFTFKTNKLCKIFTDTRIEPFSIDQINLSNSVYYEPVLYFDNIIANYKIEFVVNPSDVYFDDWLYLEKLNKIKILHKDNISFVAKIIY